MLLIMVTLRKTMHLWTAFGLTLLCVGALLPGAVFGQALTAFPGAEGAGKWTVGGRGGRVIAVTNLRDSGAGSLRAAVEASGARTVVFRLGGTIWLKSPLRVKHPFLTIAGQTAPGDGVTLAGNAFIIDAGEVIVRYLRFRPGDVSHTDVDAVSVARGSQIILDHLSTSWGVDETLSVGAEARDVTVQWCLISESLFRSVHSSGDPHGKGSLLYGKNGARISLHHNLYAHHSDRAPMVQGRDPVTLDPQGVWVDFRNNVIYDWGAVADGWEAAGANRGRDTAAFCNFVNNAYYAGPSTAAAILPVPQSPFFAYRFWAYEELSPHSRSFWAGNTFNGDLWRNASGNLDPKWMVSVSGAIGSSYFAPQELAFVSTDLPDESADVATARVMAEVGASHVRDAVDLRVLAQATNGTGGLIDSQDEVGGWPVLAAGIAPPDRDADGLPDGWEKARGLNYAYRSDANRRAPDGRTWLETYHQQLLDPQAVHLTITSEGPGTASVDTAQMPLGGTSSVTLLPDAGFIIDKILQNGVPLPLTSMSQTPPLWGDTNLHVVFARPKIPLPMEYAKPYAALLDRSAAMNNDLGGVLHLTISAKGSFSGRLWNGSQVHVVRGVVVARAEEQPKIQVQIPVRGGNSLVLDLVLMADGSVSGGLVREGDAVALHGWHCPWHSRTRPLPQRGTHLGTFDTMDLDSSEMATSRIVARSSGLLTISVRFSDRRYAVLNTWLAEDGRWLMWSRPYPGRAATHGQGSLDGITRIRGKLTRLQVPGVFEAERLFVADD